MGLWIVLLGLSVAMGVSIVAAPLFAWVLAAGAILVLMLSAPPYFWAIAALISATLLRPFTVFGLAPTYVNFFHFPLALIAALLACAKKSSGGPVARNTGIGIVALLFLSILSWLANGGEIVRPFFDWLVFCEPFLVLFAILRSELTPALYRRSWWLLLGIALAQLPLGLWQAINIGLADEMQGTFMGQGAGAHVAGAVCLVGVMICATRGAMTKSWRAKVCWFVTAALIFTFPVAADANQAIVAGVLGLALALVTCLGINPARLVLPVAAMAAVVYVGYIFYEPLQRIANTELMEEGLAGKIAGMNTVFSGMWRSPTAGLLGLGPGNSVSRVALMTTEADIKTGSPVGLLGLRTAPVTRDVLALTESSYLWRSSSAWSAISSWLGILGDLGPIGLAIYLWMIVKVWRAASGTRMWETSTMKGALLMAALLAVIYSWLEEPGFTLVLALIMGLALHRARQPAEVAFTRRLEFRAASRSLARPAAL